MTNIEKCSYKEKDVYGDYIIAFDGKGAWSFDNDFSRKLHFLVLIIVHCLILKEIFRVLMEALVHQKRV